MVVSNQCFLKIKRLLIQREIKSSTVLFLSNQKELRTNTPPLFYAPFFKDMIKARKIYCSVQLKSTKIMPLGMIYPQSPLGKINESFNWEDFFLLGRKFLGKFLHGENFQDLYMEFV